MTRAACGGARGCGCVRGLGQDVAGGRSARLALGVELVLRGDLGRVDVDPLGVDDAGERCAGAVERGEEAAHRRLQKRVVEGWRRRRELLEHRPRVREPLVGDLVARLPRAVQLAGVWGGATSTSERAREKRQAAGWEAAWASEAYWRRC